VLGDEVLTEKETKRLSRGEKQIIAALQRSGVSEMFWEYYRRLRAKGFKAVESAAGAYIAAGYKGKGGHKGKGGMFTTQELGGLIGKSRKWVSEHLADGTPLQVAAMALRIDWWTARIPAIDESLYAKATGFYVQEGDELKYVAGETTAMKLAYQRAGVKLEADTSVSVDGWTVLINQARQEAASADSGNGSSGLEQGVKG
jgi:hypothetical protein